MTKDKFGEFVEKAIMNSRRVDSWVNHKNMKRYLFSGIIFKQITNDKFVLEKDGVNLGEEDARIVIDLASKRIEQEKKKILESVMGTPNNNL